jgi:hypothetical protein
VFFVGVAALHITTPSVMTVGTFNALFPISLNVSTMPGNIYRDDLSTDTSIDAMSYLWSQLSINAGLPEGVNKS